MIPAAVVIDDSSRGDLPSLGESSSNAQTTNKRSVEATRRQMSKYRRRGVQDIDELFDELRSVYNQYIEFRQSIHHKTYHEHLEYQENKKSAEEKNKVCNSALFKKFKDLTVIRRYQRRMYEIQTKIDRAGGDPGACPADEELNLPGRTAILEQLAYSVTSIAGGLESNSGATPTSRSGGAAGRRRGFRRTISQESQTKPNYELLLRLLNNPPLLPKRLLMLDRLESKHPAHQSSSDFSEMSSCEAIRKDLPEKPQHQCQHEHHARESKAVDQLSDKEYLERQAALIQKMTDKGDQIRRQNQFRFPTEPRRLRFSQLFGNPQQFNMPITFKQLTLEAYFEKKARMQELGEMKLLTRLEAQNRYRLAVNEAILSACESWALSGGNEYTPALTSSSNEASVARLQLQRMFQVDYGSATMSVRNPKSGEAKDNVFIMTAPDDADQQEDAAKSQTQGTIVRVEEQGQDADAESEDVQSAESFCTSTSSQSLCRDSDGQSFHSDNSYYDELEDFDVACVNAEQWREKELAEMVVDPRKPPHYHLDVNRIQPHSTKAQAQKLRAIFEISELLNMPRLTHDGDIQQVSRFMLGLPDFGARFSVLTKQQWRNCLEKMKIRVFDRGHTLFRSGEDPKYAYLIFHGVINCYDDDEATPKRDNTSSDLQDNNVEAGFDSDSERSSEDSFRRLEGRFISKRNVVAYQTKTLAALKKKRMRSQSLLHADMSNATGDDVQKVLVSHQLEKVNKAMLPRSTINVAPGKMLKTDPKQIVNLVEAIKQQAEAPELTNEFLLQYQPDRTGQRVSRRQHLLRQRAGAGEIAGLCEGGQLGNQPRRTTGICKTDCIVLEFQRDIFDVLFEQRRRREQELIVEHLKATFPKINTAYTVRHILDQASRIFRREKRARGSYLQKEGEKAEKIYLIMSGCAEISKKVKFLNEYDREAVKDEPVMQVRGNDVVGEDGLWYGRRSQYSVRVASLDFTTLVADKERFRAAFSRVIPVAKEFFDLRCQFMEQRCQSLSEQARIKCAKFAQKITLTQRNQWLLYTSKRPVSLASSAIVEAKLRNVFFRQQAMLKNYSLGSTIKSLEGKGPTLAIPEITSATSVEVRAEVEPIVVPAVDLEHLQTTIPHYFIQDQEKKVHKRWPYGYYEEQQMKQTATAVATNAAQSMTTLTQAQGSPNGASACSQRPVSRSFGDAQSAVLSAYKEQRSHIARKNTAFLKKINKSTSQSSMVPQRTVKTSHGQRTRVSNLYLAKTHAYDNETTMPESSTNLSQAPLSILIDRKATSVVALGRRKVPEYSEASTPPPGLDVNEITTPLIGQIYEQQANSMLGLPLVVESNDNQFVNINLDGVPKQTSPTRAKSQKEASRPTSKSFAGMKGLDSMGIRSIVPLKRNRNEYKSYSKVASMSYGIKAGYESQPVTRLAGRQPATNKSAANQKQDPFLLKLDPSHDNSSMGTVNITDHVDTAGNSIKTTMTRQGVDVQAPNTVQDIITKSFEPPKDDPSDKGGVDPYIRIQNSYHAQKAQESVRYQQIPFEDVTNDDKDKLSSMTSSIPMIYSNKLSKAGLASPTQMQAATGVFQYLNKTQDMQSKHKRERSSRLSIQRSELCSDKQQNKGHAKKSSVIEAYSTVKTLTGKTGSHQVISMPKDSTIDENNMAVVMFDSQNRSALMSMEQPEETQQSVLCSNKFISASVVHRRFAANHVKTRQETLSKQGPRVQIRNRVTPCFFNGIDSGIELDERLASSRNARRPSEDLEVHVNGSQVPLKQRADVALSGMRTRNNKFGMKKSTTEAFLPKKAKIRGDIPVLKKPQDLEGTLHTANRSDAIEPDGTSQKSSTKNANSAVTKVIMENQKSTIQSSALIINTDADTSSQANSCQPAPRDDELGGQPPQQLKPVQVKETRFDEFLKRNQNYQSKSMQRLQKIKEAQSSARHQQILFAERPDGPPAPQYRMRGAEKNRLRLAAGGKLAGSTLKKSQSAYRLNQFNRNRPQINSYNTVTDLGCKDHDPVATQKPEKPCLNRDLVSRAGQIKNPSRNRFTAQSFNKTNIENQSENEHQELVNEFVKIEGNQINRKPNPPRASSQATKLMLCAARNDSSEKKKQDKDLNEDDFDATFASDTFQLTQAHDGQVKKKSQSEFSEEDDLDSRHKKNKAAQRVTSKTKIKINKSMALRQKIMNSDDLTKEVKVPAPLKIDRRFADLSGTLRRNAALEPSASFDENHGPESPYADSRLFQSKNEDSLLTIEGQTGQNSKHRDEKQLFDNVGVRDLVDQM